jgi:hypothetical protein
VERTCNYKFSVPALEAGDSIPLISILENWVGSITDQFQKKLESLEKGKVFKCVNISYIFEIAMDLIDLVS